MNNMTTMRMLLSTAVLAAVAAVFAGGANAVLMDVEGSGSGLTGVHAALANRAPRPAAMENTLDPAIRRAIEDRAVGLTGDSALTRHPGTATLPTASSASDGIDWSSFGLGAGMTALLAAAIAGVVLTTRRRGGIALP